MSLSGINRGDVVSPDLDERIQSLEDIKDHLQYVIDAVKEGGKSVDDYENLITQCQDWIDECTRDIEHVQDEIDGQLAHAPRYGHSKDME